MEAFGLLHEERSAIVSGWTIEFTHTTLESELDEVLVPGLELQAWVLVPRAVSKEELMVPRFGGHPIQWTNSSLILSGSSK